MAVRVEDELSAPQPCTGDSCWRFCEDEFAVTRCRFRRSVFSRGSRAVDNIIQHAATAFKPRERESASDVTHTHSEARGVAHRVNWVSDSPFTRKVSLIILTFWEVGGESIGYTYMFFLKPIILA